MKELMTLIICNCWMWKEAEFGSAVAQLVDQSSKTSFSEMW